MDPSPRVGRGLQDPRKVLWGRTRTVWRKWVRVTPTLPSSKGSSGAGEVLSGEVIHGVASDHDQGPIKT